MRAAECTHDNITTQSKKSFQSHMHMHVQLHVLIQLKERVCTTEYQHRICMC